LHIYAWFLDKYSNDYYKAEIYYKKLIKLNPKSIFFLRKYAHYLINNRKDYNQAEKYLKKAIKLDPEDVDNLNEYAAFLKEFRHDDKQCEQYYQKAVKAEQSLQARQKRKTKKPKWLPHLIRGISCAVYLLAVWFSVDFASHYPWVHGIVVALAIIGLFFLIFPISVSVKHKNYRSDFITLVIVTLPTIYLLVSQTMLIIRHLR
jgi:tetratricopeptide (TPR) repeat protein